MKKEKVILDYETGEVIEHSLETTKFIKKDEFIQIYLEDIAGLLGLKTINEYKVLVILWKYSNYVAGEDMLGNLVNTGKMTRHRISELTDLKDGTIRNIISSLVSKNVLISSNFKTSYYLNPKFFFKGKLSDRTKCYNLHLKYEIKEEIDEEIKVKLKFYSERQKL